MMTISYTHLLLPTETNHIILRNRQRHTRTSTRFQRDMRHAQLAIVLFDDGLVDSLAVANTNTLFLRIIFIFILEFGNANPRENERGI